MYTHLIGTHNVKITDNMLTLPDNFISVFNGKCILSRSFDECMMIYPISVWNDFAERLSCLPDSKKSARKLKSYFFASAEEVDIVNDKLCIPERFRNMLGTNVLMCGNGNKIEVYNELTYEEPLITDEMLSELSQYGI